MNAAQIGEEAMEQVVEAYVSNYNHGNLDGIVALFASDASVEDPVGTEPKVGHDALRAFFGVGIEAGARLQLDGTVRVAANYAAFPFHVTLEWDGQLTRIDVIDTFKFNHDGKIAEMRAFFGAKNTGAAQGD